MIMIHNMHFDLDPERVPGTWKESPEPGKCAIYFVGENYLNGRHSQQQQSVYWLLLQTKPVWSLFFPLTSLWCFITQFTVCFT